MAPYSSTLAWRIPWTEEPGGLQSMGLQKSLTRLTDFTVEMIDTVASMLLNVTEFIKLVGIFQRNCLIC